MMFTVHSGTGHSLKPVAIANSETIIDDNTMVQSFFVFKYLTHDLIIGLDMQ